MEDYNPFTDPAILEHQNGARTGSGGVGASTTAATVPTQSGYSSYVVGNNEPAAQYVIPSAKTSSTSSNQLVCVFDALSLRSF